MSIFDDMGKLHQFTPNEMSCLMFYRNKPHEFYHQVAYRVDEDAITDFLAPRIMDNMAYGDTVLKTFINPDDHIDYFVADIIHSVIYKTGYTMIMMSDDDMKEKLKERFWQMWNALPEYFTTMGQEVEGDSCCFSKNTYLRFETMEYDVGRGMGVQGLYLFNPPLDFLSEYTNIAYPSLSAAANSKFIISTHDVEAHELVTEMISSMPKNETELYEIQ